MAIQDDVVIGGSGAINFSNASTNRVVGANSVVGGASDPDSLTIGSEQQISGVVSFSLPVTNDGVLSPGNSAGTMTFLQGLALSGTSTLAMEVLGFSANQRDLINVTGTVNLAGRLQLSLPAAFVAVLSPFDSFTLVDSNVAIGGQFFDLLPGERVVANNGASFKVDYGVGAIDPTAIVLRDFQQLTEQPTDTVTNVSGTAQGGDVTIVVDGVEFTISTQAGDSSAA